MLLSTHHLDEVVAYCSRVGIVEEGALIDEVNLSERRDRYRLRSHDALAAKLALETQPYIRHVTTRGDETVFVLEDDSALGQVGAVLAAANISLLELGRDTFDLRAYYRERLQEQRTRPASTDPDPALPDDLQIARQADKARADKPRAGKLQPDESQTKDARSDEVVESSL